MTTTKISRVTELAPVSASVRKTADTGRWFVGLTRNSIMAAERYAVTDTTKSSARQIASMVMGTTFIGLGVALFVRANLGVPAFDVMLTALRDRFGISLGQAGWLLTGSLFLVAASLGRRPTWSNLAFLLLNGLTVDMFTTIIRSPQGLAVRMAVVVLGTMALAAGVALILHADLSGGATELLMQAGKDRGIDPFKVRLGIDLGIVTGGIVLGGDVGPATLFFILTMSPLMRIGGRALKDHRAGRQLRMATAGAGPVPSSAD